MAVDLPANPYDCPAAATFLTGATIAKAVNSGDVGRDEITPEEAAIIIGAP